MISFQKHKFKLNLENGHLSYFDNNIAWSSKTEVVIGRIAKKQLSQTQPELEIRKVIRLPQHLKNIKPFGFQKSYNLSMSQLDDQTCSLYFVSGFTRGEEGALVFNRLTLDRESFEVKEACQVPIEGGAGDRGPPPKLYQALGFLVFTQKGVEKANDALQDFGTDKQEFHQLCLASMNFEIYDTAKLCQVSETGSTISPSIFCLNGEHIVAQGSPNRLNLYKIVPKVKILNLVKTIKLPGLEIQSSGNLSRTPSEGFGCSCLVSGDQLGPSVILKFSKDLELLGSLVVAQEISVSRVFYLKNGELVAQALSKVGHVYARDPWNDWKRSLFKVNFEHRKLENLAGACFEIESERVSLNGRFCSLAKFGEDALIQFIPEE